MQQRVGFAFRTIVPIVANLATFVLLPALIFGLPFFFGEPFGGFERGDRELPALSLKLAAISTVLAWSSIHAVAELFFGFQLTTRNVIAANLLWGFLAGLPFVAWLLMVSSC